MSVTRAPAPVDSADALPQAARAAARDLILCLADTKRVLGLRYSDWILGAPELEAGIAASGMAQDEWGHARILYALLKDFGDDPQEVEHGRDASAYRSIEALDAPIETWPEFVAANALVDTALTVMLESLADGALAPVASRLRKQIEEERFHFAHGVAWLRRLTGAGAESRTEVGAACARAWPATLRWFGPPRSAATDALAASGVLARAGDELRARFLQRVGPALHEGGLELVTPSANGFAARATLAWSSWDEPSRRAGGTALDEETAARARGDKNRVFLMD